MDTTVDATSAHLGRHASFVARVARDAGMRVVLATCIWRDAPRYFASRNTDAVALWAGHSSATVAVPADHKRHTHLEDCTQ